MQTQLERQRIDVLRWREVYGRDSIELLGGNFYRSSEGYLTDHIPPHLRRDLPIHWDQQFENAAAFEQSWLPRMGPLEFVHGLAVQKDEPLLVVNFGGGLGDFSIDLVTAANAWVTQVDFSGRANTLATIKARSRGIESEKFQAATVENKSYLRYLKEIGEKPDFIFFYGGLGENTPGEKDIRTVLKLAAEVLAPEGYIWYVGLEQPFLVDPNDTRATDILGEYPVRPGLITQTMVVIPGIELIREEVGERPDKHPLQPGEEAQEHMHIVHRALFGKNLTDPTPDFDFKNSVGDRWGEKWDILSGRL